MEPENNNPNPTVESPVSPVVDQTVSQTNNPTPPKKKFPFIIVIAIVMFLLTISGAAGFYIYKNVNTKSGPIACTAEARICPDGSSVGRTGPKCEFSPCPTPTPNPTANWKTYSGETFSFKYPSDAILNQTKNISIRKGDELNIEGCLNVRVEQFDNQNTTDIEEWITNDSIANLPDGTISSQIRGKINLLNGQPPGYWYEGGIEIITKVVLFVRKPTVYKITLAGVGGAGNRYLDCPINEQILSTFKFTDSEQAIDTSDWKTYTSLRGNYSIKYPKDYTLNVDKVAGVDGVMLEVANQIQLISTTIPGTNGNFAMTILFEPTNLSLEEYIDSTSQCIDLSSNIAIPIEIDGNPALKTPYTICGPRGAGYFFTLRNNVAYRVEVESTLRYEEALPYVDQILSTFKFTE